MARESVPDKTPPQNTADMKAARRGKKEDQIRLIGEGIVNNLSNFVNNFIAKSKSMQLENARNIKRDRTDMFKVFSGAIKEDELLPNILAFKDYLKTSGESIEDFAEGLGENGESFKKTIKAFDDDVKAITTRESALKKAGLVTEQEIVDGKLQLKVLNKSEIRDKQREIINKRKQISDIEQLIEKETKATDENGRLTVEQKDKIEQLTKNVEELDQGIQDIKNTGVKEVKTVLTGFAGDVADFYTRQRDGVTGFIDAFMPGPVAQVFNSLVQAVEGLVKQVMDLFKPITATIGAIIKAPRFIAKKFFGKTDEQIDEMFKPLKDFGKRVGNFLLKPLKVVGKFMLDMFLRPLKLVGMLFKSLGGFLKKIVLGFKALSLKTLLIVGILAILGIGIFLLVKKFKEIVKFIDEKIIQPIVNTVSPIIDKIVDAFTKLKDAVISVYEFLFGKSGEERDKELQEEKEELMTSDKVMQTNKAKVKARDQLINAIREEEKASGEKVTNKNDLRTKSVSELTKIAESKGVDKEIVDRGKIDAQILKSQRAEDRFLMKTKAGDLFSDEQRKEFGLTKGQNMISILQNKKLMANERLTQTDAFKEAMLKKAEFDAEQAALLRGQQPVANTATNITNNQTAGTYGHSPTRDNYAPYVDANAMSYGMVR